MLLGSVQAGPVKLQIFILCSYSGILLFLACLIQLEKENKFRYRAVARLLLVRTQHPPPRRSSQGPPVGAWAACYARWLQHKAGACALKHEPLNENAPFFFLSASIRLSKYTGKIRLEVPIWELPSKQHYK